MTINKKITISMVAIILAVVGVFGSYFVLNTNNANLELSDVDVSELPIYSIRASFVYDVNNINEAVGISDYVFVGKVVSNNGTHYEDIVTMEDENGLPKEVGTPYTDYTIDVLENIKGILQTSVSIEVVKHGGIFQDKSSVCLFENDQLPIVGNSYVFLGYAQKDGSILISGPNSNVPIVATNGRAFSQSANEYQAYKNAYENEVIPVERERFNSVYEN